MLCAALLLITGLMSLIKTAKARLQLEGGARLEFGDSDPPAQMYVLEFHPRTLAAR